MNTFFLGILSQTPNNSDNEGYSSDEHVPKTAIGTANYHNNRISHHQKKQAFHEAMSTHLGNTKFKRLAQDHGKEAAHSKDLMAIHNDYKEGIENGNYFAGSKTTKRKKVTEKLPNPPKNPQEAMSLINKPDQPWEMKHNNDPPSKHLPDDQIEEKRKKLQQRLRGDTAGTSSKGNNRSKKGSIQPSQRSSKNQKGKGKGKRG